MDCILLSTPSLDDDDDDASFKVLYSIYLASENKMKKITFLSLTI